MHTTKVLQSSDFRYVRRSSPETTEAGLTCLYPDYHTADRIGVVSPCLEDGLMHTAYALLGLTTTFYDCLRSDTADFYDYPRHFALIGMTTDGLLSYGRAVVPDEASLEASWGNLDVWPDSQWLFAPATATAMIKKVFDFQINRLFWPQDLLPGPGEGKLPGYLRRMLKTRLRSVYFYNVRDPDLEIHVTQPVEDMVRGSLAQLPRTTGSSVDAIARRQDARVIENGGFYRECYRQINVQEFLARLDVCFESC